MNPSPSAQPADYFGFTDLTALQAAHTRLIKRQGLTPLPPDFLDAVDAFVIQAQATGRALEHDDSRTAAQTIIDYWVTVLLRSRRTPPETGLAEYGFHAPTASIRDRSASEYLTDERVAIRKRLRLSAAAAQWNDSERDRSLLWGGTELPDAANYGDLTALEKEFIAAGFADKKRTTLIRQSVIIVAALVLLGMYLRERKYAHEAQHQLATTLVERAAVRMGEGDVASSVVWLAQALRHDEKARNADGQAADRRRLGAALAQLPKLDQLFVEEQPEYLTNQAKWSADGKHVLTIANHPKGTEGAARLYDAETGAKLADFPDPGARVIDAGFCADGRIMTASGTADGKTALVRFWPREGGAPIPLPDAGGAIRSASLSPAGDRVALLYKEPTGIEVRNVADLRAATPLLPWNGTVKRIVFSPDGSLIAAFGTVQKEGATTLQQQVRVWEAATGTEKKCGALNYDVLLNSAAISPDNRYLVTAADKLGAKRAGVEVRDLETETGARLFTTEQTDQVTSAVFSPDGRRVVSASYDQTARVLDARTGRALLEFKHDSSVTQASYSPDGRFVASGSRDHTARVWRVATGSLALPPLNHGFTVSTVTFSPDGERLLTTAPDGARSWLLRTGEPVAPVLQLKEPIWKMAIAHDGLRVIAVSRAGWIIRWDRPDGEPVRAPLPALNSAEAIFFSGDATRALISKSGKARVWDTKERVPIGPEAISIPGARTYTYALFNRDGSRVLLASEQAGGGKGAAEIFEVASGRRIGQSLAVQGVVTYAVFSEDGRHVLTASGTTNPSSGEARVWDAETGEPRTPPLTHLEGVTHASINAGLTRVVTASIDDTAKIWDIDLARGSEQKPRVLVEHTADLTHAAFSPDGKYVVTASFDRTAVLWDAASGQRLRLLEHPGAINDARFDPTGRYLVTACADQAVRVWAVPSGDWISLFRHEGEVTRAFFTREEQPDECNVITLSSYEPAQLLRRAQRSISVPGAFDAGSDEPIRGTMLRARVWRIPAAKGSVADLEDFTQLLISRGIEKNRDLVRLKRSELTKIWNQGKNPVFESFRKDLTPLALPPMDAVEESEATGDWFAARWHLDRLLATKPGDTALLLRRGAASGNLRDWQQAVADYETALAAKPDTDLLKRLARARIELGQFDHAAERATQAIQISPEDRALSMLRAEAFAAKARWDEAATDLSKAIDLKPDAPSGYSRLGIVRLKQNRPADYAALTAKMVKLFDNDDGFAGTAAWACVLRPDAGADPETVLKLARRGVDDDPRSYYPLNTLGAALYRAGYFQKAIDQLEISRKAYLQVASAAQFRGDTDIVLMPVQDGRTPDWLFLAMAHHKLSLTPEMPQDQKLENAVKARQWLEKSREAVASKNIHDPRRTWHRIELELLLEEATALLGNPPAAY